MLLLPAQIIVSADLSEQPSSEDELMQEQGQEGGPSNMDAAQDVDDAPGTLPEIVSFHVQVLAAHASVARVCRRTPC